MDSLGSNNTFSYFLFNLVCFLITLHNVNSKLVERSTYIVHADKSIMPKAFTSHHHWYSSIVTSLKYNSNFASLNNNYEGDHLSPSLLYSYDNALHGFCASLSIDELEELKKAPWFITSYVDHKATLDTTHTYEFLSLNPSYGLWPASNHGEDVIIGVIDSGVWPESESFKDNGILDKIPSKWKGKCEPGQEFNSSMCNFKLIGARYFNRGLIIANPNVTIDMSSARDTFGHGTHVASTAAGNYVKDASYFGYAKGTARGIAPKARLAIYKVSWDQGSHASDVIAAIDQAIEDGVDVISISMGFDGIPLYQDPVAIASFAAMEKGVVVSTSAGNNGPSLSSLHNGIPWTLTVAASTTDRSFFGRLSFEGNNFTINGLTMFPANVILENIPLIYNNEISTCNSTELLKPMSYGIILCDDIGSVPTQIYHLTSAQVLGAIILSDDKMLLEGGGVTCPCVVISLKDAQAVIKYAKNGFMPLVSIKFQQTFIGNKPAPSVAFYSSRGPSLSYPGILKPDIMAPGSLVLAAWVPNKMAAQIGSNIFLSSDYNVESGTSMACPHVSGVAALLKGSHPDWSPAAIRSAIMTTANPVDNTQNPIRDNGNMFEFASPLAMGAGQIDPNRALDPGLIYDATPQDYVKLLCSTNFTKKQILAITRSHHYECSKTSYDLNYPSFIAFQANKNTTMVQKFKRTLTNMGEGVVTYNVKVTAPKGSVVKVSPQKLVFERKYDKQKYSVYMKYKRNYKQKVSFGELVWIEENGSHTVRSPIAVSPVWNALI